MVVARAIAVMCCFGALAATAVSQVKPPSNGNALPVTGRSVVTTKYGIVAASQTVAAAAGVQILEHGGNAVDAAIATNAVIGLMEPMGNGVGGDLFVLYYEAKSRNVYGLNASGWSPNGLTPEFLSGHGVHQMPQAGINSVTVPGVVAGWQTLHDRFGTMPLFTLLEPAIDYADNGVPINEVTALIWNYFNKLICAQPNMAATYLTNGRAPKSGEVFRNPDLANSLRRIAAKGRDGFYKGPTAEAIVSISKEMGGTMTLEDLADFRPEWVRPISTTYRGWKVYELPPNTQGIAALEMLNIMESFPMKEYGFQSPKALHTMIEAKKLAYADMLRYVGDPRFSTIPVTQMLDKKLAAERASEIKDTARCSVEPAVLPGVTDVKGKTQSI